MSWPQTWRHSSRTSSLSLLALFPLFDPFISPTCASYDFVHPLCACVCLRLHICTETCRHVCARASHCYLRLCWPSSGQCYYVTRLLGVIRTLSPTKFSGRDVGAVPRFAPQARSRTCFSSHAVAILPGSIYLLSRLVLLIIKTNPGVEMLLSFGVGRTF